MKLTQLFLEMLSALDRGRWRMVRLLHKKNCSCCIRGSRTPAVDIMGPKLSDEMPARIVDAVFQELNNPTDRSPRCLPSYTEHKHDGPGLY